VDQITFSLKGSRLGPSAAAGTIAITALGLTVVLFVIGAGADDAAHRVTLLLCLPTGFVAISALAACGIQLVRFWLGRRRGGWGFDTHSGMSWGTYGEDFQSSFPKHRRGGFGRRKRTKNR
jgi:hypothetical protein